MSHARLLTVAAVALALGGGAPAHACADNANCGPAASPIRTLYDACSALPILNPGNDTRVNFWLLADDAQPFAIDALRGRLGYPPYDLWPVPFSYTVLRTAALPRAEPNAALTPFALGEGTRCVSEARGRADFAAAVQAAALPPEEKTALVALRGAIGGKCGGAATVENKDRLRAVIKSDLGQAFLRYIGAAAAFYDAGFDEAIASFENLSKSPDPWLKESATYMIGRALLNKGQIGAFGVDDSDTEPKAKDIDSLKAAEKAFGAYLHAWPSGRYAASARGLMRRLYWLESDSARLADEYSRLATEKAADAPARVAITDEIDQKMIIPGLDQTRNPLLVATLDLRRMRSGDDKKFTAAELDAQEPIFAEHKALFAYLRAARAFYVDNDSRTALALLGPSGSAQSNLDFSREFLRGLAMNAAGDSGAEAVWKGLIAGADRPWRRETAELGLAWAWERARTVNKVFMPDSPVRSEPIREILLRNVAGPIILRQQADDKGASPRERAVARFTLLYKEATHGLYAGFLKDLAAGDPSIDEKEASFNNSRKLDVFRWPGQSAPFACPPLKAVVEKLATAPKNPQALLCFGDFLRTQAFDEFELDKPPEPDQLGGQKPIFPGQTFSRGEAYKALIADPATPDDARAYAYFRAIHCYEPSGINSCGGAGVSKGVRKGWYDSLKARYGALPYVKSLRYYW